MSSTFGTPVEKYFPAGNIMGELQSMAETSATYKTVELEVSITLTSQSTPVPGPRCANLLRGTFSGTIES